MQRLLAAPRVQQLWVEANGAAHQKLINVLENKTGNGIDTGNGAVTLDLSQLLTELGVDLGLPSSVLEQLPPDAGVVTIMTSDQLSAAQTAVRLIRLPARGCSCSCSPCSPLRFTWRAASGARRYGTSASPSCCSA